MIGGVLLDLSGVIYVGDHALPGAIDALGHLRQSGLPLRFLTNTTRSPKSGILARLHGMGVTIGEDELFTPAQAACDYLAVLNHCLIESRQNLQIPDSGQGSIFNRWSVLRPVRRPLCCWRVTGWSE